jgi:hypothetical protein
MEENQFMPRLLNMATRFFLKNALAFLMLFAVCAPYVHAAAEIGKHEHCSMEMCKRTGKCCCRQNHLGKPHWGSKDVCHQGASQLPRTISPVAVLSAEAHRLQGLALIAEFAVADTVVKPVAPLPVVDFQLPPPALL